MQLDRFSEALTNVTDVVRRLDQRAEDECYSGLIELERQVRQQLQPSVKVNKAWLVELGEALLNSPYTIAAEVRVQLLLLLVLWHSGEGEYDCALFLAEKAVEIAVHANAPSLERKALNHLGVLHMEMMNYTEATICLVKGIQIADRLGDRLAKSAMIANLAVVRFTGGLFDESIKLYQYVLEVTSYDPVQAVIKSDAHHNIASVLLLLDDLENARSHAMEALRLRPLVADLTGANQRVQIEHTMIRVASTSAQLEEAKEHLCRCEELAMRAGTRVARVFAQMSRCWFEAASGEIESALERLRALEDEIRPDENIFGDLLETGLFCNRMAGRSAYTRHYRTKYLSNLAEWRRRIAIQQVAVLKRALLRAPLTEGQIAILPIEVSAALGSNEASFAAKIEALATLAELREDATGEHAVRVAQLAEMLALAIGYGTERAREIGMASRLHDIGKLAIPDVVLLKRGRLSSAELQIMQRHTTEGCIILTDLMSALESTSKGRRSDAYKVLRRAAEMALHHHEWWNGSGYPRRLHSTAIPEEARIVALADVFDELTHARPYRQPCTSQEAIARIEQLSGIQFEPRLCSEFLKIVRELVTSNEIPAAPLEPPSPFVAANRVIQRIVRSAGREVARAA